MPDTELQQLLNTFLSTGTLSGLWIIFFYLFIKRILPDIIPLIMAEINKREDRLYELVTATMKSNEDLKSALSSLSATLKSIEQRIEEINGRNS